MLILYAELLFDLMFWRLWRSLDVLLPGIQNSICYLSTIFIYLPTFASFFFSFIPSVFFYFCFISVFAPDFIFFFFLFGFFFLSLSFYISSLLFSVLSYFFTSPPPPFSSSYLLPFPSFFHSSSLSSLVSSLSFSLLLPTVFLYASLHRSHPVVGAS